MCRTFSLPEIKQADFQAAAKALEASFDGQQFQFDGCDVWADDALFNLLDQIPGEVEMDLDGTSIEDDSSVSQSSVCDLSSISHSSVGSVYQPSHLLPTFNFGANFGLRSMEEGFVALPDSKSFAHVTMRTPEMIREEKLNAIDPFVGALNEGDIFSLFSLCQSQCASNVVFESNSCGFRYAGTTALITFWTLLFEKHYQGRLQCLERRVSSSLKPMGRSSAQPSFANAGNFEGADFVLKLEGSRLSEFRNFDMFQALMNSGYIHENLSLPELIHFTEVFYRHNQNGAAGSMIYPGQLHHQIYHMTYIFEVSLKFHAIHNTITSWKMELIAVEAR